MMLLWQSIKNLPVFRSLRSRDFRWFWLARLANSASMQMGSVAQGWLVYELTGSALALGWVSSARSVARFLLSLYGGALADHLKKRQILIYARIAMLVNVLIIAILIFTGAVQVWHMVAYSFIGGVISALMMPSQKAYLAQLVDRKELLNAVSLVFASMGLMGIFGASMSGFVIAWLGVETVYFIIALLYAGAVLALSKLPPESDSQHQREKITVWKDLRDGIAYLKIRPAILPLLGIVVVRVILGSSYGALMPVYASEVLQTGAQGLGLLSTAPAFGSLFGSLALASLGEFRGKGKILLLSGITMGLSMIGFSLSKNFAIAFFCLTVVGGAQRGIIITSQTLIQMNCEDAYRGRIMAMYLMSMGLMPLSTLPAGAIADTWGVPSAFMIQGGLMAIIFVVILLSQPKVRRMA